VEVVATAAMLAAGYHQHHGQWRRKRHGQGDRQAGRERPGGGGG
jgi:hypothetical protein